MKFLALNLTILAFLGAIDAALIIASIYYPSFIISENGLVENLQLVFLGMTTSVFLSAATRQTNATRAAAIALAWTSVAFFFRELDFRGLGLPAPIEFLTSPYVRDPLFLGILLGVGLYMLTKRHFLRDWIAMILHPRAVVLVAAAFFLAAGHFLDDIYGRTIWEEVCEVNGYILFFAAAIKHHNIGNNTS